MVRQLVVVRLAPGVAAARCPARRALELGFAREPAAAERAVVFGVVERHERHRQAWALKASRATFERRRAAAASRHAARVFGDRDLGARHPKPCHALAVWRRLALERRLVAALR